MRMVCWTFTQTVLQQSVIMYNIHHKDQPDSRRTHTRRTLLPVGHLLTYIHTHTHTRRAKTQNPNVMAGMPSRIISWLKFRCARFVNFIKTRLLCPLARRAWRWWSFAYCHRRCRRIHMSRSACTHFAHFTFGPDRRTPLIWSEQRMWRTFHCGRIVVFIFVRACWHINAHAPFPHD